MIDDDIRVLIAVTYKFDCADYSLARSKLAAKAWSAAKDAIQEGFYLAVTTFPLWNSREGMLAFSPIDEHYDVTSISCVCYQVNSSPISDWIATDKNRFIIENMDSLCRFISSVASDYEFSSLFLLIGSSDDVSEVHRTDKQGMMPLLWRLVRESEGDVAIHVTS